MTTATIFEAKTKLSELVKRAQAGETVIITSGRDKKPVAELKAIAPVKHKRLGFLEHLNLHIPDSFFFDPLPEEELRLWEGEDADDPCYSTGEEKDEGK
jgi:antitoxin (DNA-binding transcriptional repressor) of toxin-antitoxin stability system